MRRVTIGALMAGAAVLIAAAMRQGSNPTDEQGKAILGRLVKNWSVSGRSIDEDGRVDATLSGTAYFVWGLGDNFVMGEMALSNGRAMMASFEAFGYAPQDGSFTLTEMTTIDRAMFLSTGSLDPSSGSVSFKTINPLATPEGKSRSVDTTLAFPSDGTVQLTMVYREDGAPDGMIQLVLAPAQQQQAPQGQSGQSPMQSIDQVQQQLQSMISQKQQMQQQMNDIQSKMQQMSQSFHDGILAD